MYPFYFGSYAFCGGFSLTTGKKEINKNTFAALPFIPHYRYMVKYEHNEVIKNQTESDRSFSSSQRTVF